MIAVRLTLPWEVEEELRRRALYYPPPVNGIAVIDTGASYSGIDRSIIKKLKLNPTGIEKAFTPATGRRTVRPTYAVRFIFPGSSLGDFQVPTASPHGLAAPFVPEGMTGKVIAILGRDFLKYYTFTYDGPTGKFSLVTNDEDPAAQP